MPKLNRWIKVTKKCHFFAPEEIGRLTEFGANLGTSHCESFQIINVNAKNRELVIKYLEEKGFTVSDVEE